MGVKPNNKGTHCAIERGERERETNIMTARTGGVNLRFLARLCVNSDLASERCRDTEMFAKICYSNKSMDLM